MGLRTQLDRLSEILSSLNSLSPAYRFHDGVLGGKAGILRPARLNQETKEEGIDADDAGDAESGVLGGKAGILRPALR